MSAPHRGLPPPAAMTLPLSAQQPSQPVNQTPLNQNMEQLPAPPNQWQGAEESMRNWLYAKAEEDKRKQEEERTRQEALRLEQRKIEQDMLRTSLSGGIPPYMIPMVFTGIGGGNLPTATLEWAQYHMAQAHNPQQQQQQQPLLPLQAHSSPEQQHERETRSILHYGSQHKHSIPIPIPSTPVGIAGPQQSAGFPPTYQISPVSTSRSRQSSQSQVPSQQTQASHLPRLNTAEIHAQAPLVGPSLQIASEQPSHPLQQPQAPQQEPQSSSIYFHHWQPPTSQAGNSSNFIPPRTLPDHTLSPKKRKAIGPQQAVPAPRSQTQYTSPISFQTGSLISNTTSSRRRGHARQRSEHSSRVHDAYSSRSTTRHRQHEGGFTFQGFASPPRQTQTSENLATSTEPRKLTIGSHPVSSLLEQDIEPRHHPQSQPQMKPQAQRSGPIDRPHSISPAMRAESRPNPEEEVTQSDGKNKQDERQE